MGKRTGRLALEAGFYLDPLEKVGQVLDGRFVAARYVCARDELEVMADPLGSHAVHAAEVQWATWVSTRPDALRRLTPHRCSVNPSSRNFSLSVTAKVREDIKTGAGLFARNLPLPPRGLLHPPRCPSTLYL